MNILKTVFILFLVLFPIAELGRWQLSGGVAIKVNDLALVVVVCTWIILLLTKRFVFPVSKHVLIAFGLFIVAAVLSLIVNSLVFQPHEILVGSLYLVRWILYATLLPIVISFSDRDKKHILFVLIGIGALTVLAGYIQYFFYHDLRNLYYLGWDEHMYRMFTSFLDPNFAGAFFVLYVLLLLATSFYSWQKKMRKTSLILGLLLVSTVGAIFLTYSRSALLMFLTSSFVFLLLMKRIKWILGIILILVIFVTIASRSFSIENLNLLRTASSEARVHSAETALKIIERHPIVGVGFNTYRYAQVKYGYRTQEGIQSSHADAGTDNSFLFVLATTGIIGLVAYGYLWFVLSRNIGIPFHTKQLSVSHLVSVVVIASMSGLIVNSLFINSLFYPYIMEWMWVVIGLTLSTSRYQRPKM